MGTPYGWADWNLDGNQFGAQCRVSMDGGSIQFRNNGKKITKVSAEHGSRRFTITVAPGQSRDIANSGDAVWHWTIILAN
jgi:hypothetical protein